MIVVGLVMLGKTSVEQRIEFAGISAEKW